MREIIKVLIKEGIKTEDIVAITEYIKESYDIVEGSKVIRKNI